MEQFRATEGTLNTLNFKNKKANSVDPDQMPHFGTSELGLHHLHMSPKTGLSGLESIHQEFRILQIFSLSLKCPKNENTKQ